MFRTRRYGPIGLDLGTEGIRMLQLGRAGGRYAVAAAGRWHYPAGAEDPARRRELAVGAVGDMLRAGGFHGRDVVSCISAAQLSINNVRLPQMPEEELASAVAWECQERFGFQVTPDRVHYINAGEVRHGSETRDEIILLAVTEQTVREHLELLEEMALRPLHIDAEPTALFRAYRRFLRRAQDESAVTVIVDVGLSTTKVVVARGTTIVLIKAIDVAGRRFNEVVAKELGLSYEEARHLRQRVAQACPPGAEGAKSYPENQTQWSVFDAVRGEMEALAREVGLCLRYCSVTFRGLRADQVTLTGGEACDPALLKVLGEALDCQCVVGEPLRGIDLGKAELGADRRGVLTEWSVAAGLALRELMTEKRTTTERVGHEERRRVPA